MAPRETSRGGDHVVRTSKLSCGKGPASSRGNINLTTKVDVNRPTGGEEEASF